MKPWSRQKFQLSEKDTEVSMSKDTQTNKKKLQSPLASCWQQILIRLLILSNFRLSFLVSKNKHDVGSNIDVVNRVIPYASLFISESCLFAFYI